MKIAVFLFAVIFSFFANAKSTQISKFSPSNNLTIHTSSSHQDAALIMVETSSEEEWSENINLFAVAGGSFSFSTFHAEHVSRGTASKTNTVGFPPKEKLILWLSCFRC